MHFTTPLLTLLSLSSTALSLGINCRGNGNCGLPDSRASLDRLRDVARGAGDHHFFQNGDHIACLQFGGAAGGSLCAFPQGTRGGIEGWKAKQLLGFIRDHGCTRCGSVPVNFPNDNDVNSAGQLTVNWVS
ncbi:killer toxin [Ophiobolus disseminans]|uniref:Killer toxin n=1 Tax=Ophiobolus disseminans TaxID=1469910 RepID=A0A6A6ZKA8_9PLEO|nr:killer toxin [Ophiobolus disseminans]